MAGCEFKGAMEEVDGVVVQCPKCGNIWNPQDHDLLDII